jgi:ABC-2 type transport system ATP-binding protein
MRPAINVDRLVKRYKKADRNAVDDISFSVAEGEFFALLGPNGAGKTTTVSVLTTTLSKTGGAVEIAGFDLDKQASAIRRNVGVIFQAPSLDLNLTAEENIRFHALLYGLYPFRPSFSMMPQEYQARVKELAGVLGIQDAIFKPIRTFSGGMKRKLEIVRSLIHKPRVLFLDEPTTGLDPMSRKNLWEYLQKIRREEHVTIFLTTHYLEEAEEADHIGIINHGTLVMYGTPKDLKEKLLQDQLVVDARDRKRLHAELLKHTTEVSESAPFVVKVGDGIKAQTIIKSISMPLTVLDIERPTLEEAYVKIIEQDHQAA